MTVDPTDIRPEEIYATAIAGMLQGARHVAVGMVSPIPGTGALLASELGGGRPRVSILGSKQDTFWTDGGSELFDLAGRGRVDGFFLSGGQIDGAGNVNLVGVGDYPQAKARWSGCFGSAYLAFVVPRLILFRWEHTRRTMVEKVDFVSAPGASPETLHRPGGPIALITERCLFDFDRKAGRFSLRSLHPGHSLEEVRDNTGFDFDAPDIVPTTPLPDAETLALLRGPVAQRIAGVYPLYARDVWGIEAAA
ncbi:CoA-transferase [Rhodovulum sp. DZ06]|uniref:CoA-transferase n=1 Tax=Rhodovulum sp. DZ06 TaxID=3425126 RepID=UPI003D33EB28